MFKAKEMNEVDTGRDRATPLFALFRSPTLLQSCSRGGRGIVEDNLVFRRLCQVKIYNITVRTNSLSVLTHHGVGSDKRKSVRGVASIFVPLRRCLDPEIV